jgi:lysophospholipase L1-like esterase
MALRAHPIVCLGDSITAGKSVPENRRWTSLLQSELDARETGRWEVYTRGVPGETVVQGLQRFEKDVTPLLPGFVLIEFGLNDCSRLPDRQIPRTGIMEFEAHLGEIVRLVSHCGGQPVLLTNHPVDPKQQEQSSGLLVAESLAPYQEAIRIAASKHGTALLDVEAGVGKAWAAGCLAADGIHLSPDGHRLYAEAVFRGLVPILEEPFSCLR